MSVKIIVHSLDEKKQLEDQRIQNVFHIPLGVLDFHDEEKSDCRNKLGISGNPVIASFGFLRPHKGVLEAIDAVSILKDQYPNIKFLGVNALYPSEDSEQYYKLCEERINDLKLNDNVVLLTSFFEMDQIIHYLHASDLIVLPYHDSKEGSSAAANMAIASKRPLVISNSGIFSAIKSVSYLMENIDPPTISSELQKLLSNPELLDKMKNKVVNYVNENSYIKIADKYTNILFGKRKMDYESILQRVYESFLESGDVAIDVGAHVGRHTIPIAKKISSDGRVYAVEPLPMGQKSLQNLLNSGFQNLSANIKLYPYALSDYEEESEFTFVVNNPGYSGLKEREFDNNAKLKKIKVPVKKLDNVFSDLNALRYIKIDAEGGEFNIMKGGINTIKRFRPVVTFEFGASSYAAYSVIPEQVFLFWRELNYDVFDILGNKLENENIFAQSSIDQNVWVYIAIPVENKTITENFLRGAHKYLTPHLINNYSKQEGLSDDLMTTNIQISMKDLITFIADQLQFSQS
ncbi:MAG: FkbM family methyltransferase, partial [ANME-2 cluster archaeon]